MDNMTKELKSLYLLSRKWSIIIHLKKMTAPSFLCKTKQSSLFTQILPPISNKTSRVFGTWINQTNSWTITAPWPCGLIHHVLDREVRGSNLGEGIFFSPQFITIFLQFMVFSYHSLKNLITSDKGEAE